MRTNAAARRSERSSSHRSDSPHTSRELDGGEAADADDAYNQSAEAADDAYNQSAEAAEDATTQLHRLLAAVKPGKSVSFDDEVDDRRLSAGGSPQVTPTPSSLQGVLPGWRGGLSTRSTGLPHPVGAISCIRKAAPLTDLLTAGDAHVGGEEQGLHHLRHNAPGSAAGQVRACRRRLAADWLYAGAAGASAHAARGARLAWGKGDCLLRFGPTRSFLEGFFRPPPRKALVSRSSSNMDLTCLEARECIGKVGFRARFSSSPLPFMFTCSSSFHVLRFMFNEERNI